MPFTTSGSRSSLSDIPKRLKSVEDAVKSLIKGESDHRTVRERNPLGSRTISVGEGGPDQADFNDRGTVTIRGPKKLMEEDPKLREMWQQSLESAKKEFDEKIWIRRHERSSR